MDRDAKVSTNQNQSREEDEEETSVDLRRGPWTVDEDFALINYVAHHGEGRWNSLAKCAGLRRTGKSCRLRWLNYLRPDVRRGNITLEEQLLILELHSRWGNRWSKIAQHLPGRTDNEIKNYWRTRVQKHAKQLNCDVNSKQFKDTMRYLWMPRLVERIQAAGGSDPTAAAPYPLTQGCANPDPAPAAQITTQLPQQPVASMNGGGVHTANYASENSCAAASSDSFGTPASDMTDCYNNYVPVNNHNHNHNNYAATATTTTTNQLAYVVDHQQPLPSPTGYFGQGLDFADHSSQWMDGGDVSDSLWSDDDVWFLQQQFYNN